MRKLCLAASLVTFLMATTAPARASHGPRDFVKEGNILLPGLMAQGMGNILVGLCDPTNPAQGVDGYWIKLPADSGGHDFTLTSVEGDVDVRGFGDEDCGFLGSWEHDGDEAGIVPETAEWALVTLWIGIPNARFTFTVNKVLPAL